MTAQTSLCSPAARAEVYLLERESTATAVHLIEAGGEGLTDVSAFDAVFSACDSVALEALLPRVLRDHGGRVAIFCPAETLALFRRRVQLTGCSRVVVPSATDSLVLKLGRFGASLIAACREVSEVQV
jgi:hypothetical protein